MYYQSLSGTVQPLDDASMHLDSYGWTQSWRANDDAAGTLWNASDGMGNWLFPFTPFVFVIDTKTMTIVKTENAGAIDPLTEVSAINAANP